MEALSELIAKINELSKEEQVKVFKHFNQLLNEPGNGEHAIYKVRRGLHESQPIICPSCGTDQWIKFGTYHGMQKYRCKSCKKTFTALTGTSVHWIHDKKKWEIYLDCMLQGLSLHQCAKRTGICYKTSFDWRHKLLRALKHVGCSKLTGVIEADETFFLSSRKGMKVLARKPRKRGESNEPGLGHTRLCVLTAIDRNNNFRLEVTGKGKPTSKQIEQAMKTWVSKQNNKYKKSILCTDGNIAYQKLIKRKNLSHYKVFNYDRKWSKTKLYHLQHVNNLHSKLKNWIRIFHGVSDIYFKNYLTYFRILELIKNYQDPIKIYQQLTLTKNSVFIPVKHFKKYFLKQYYYI